MSLVLVSCSSSRSCGGRGSASSLAMNFQHQFNAQDSSVEGGCHGKVICHHQCQDDDGGGKGAEVWAMV